MARRVLAASLFICLVSGALGAQILCLFFVPSRSHMIIYDSLLKELAKRGHQLTVVSNYPQKEPVDNYTDIVLTRINDPLDGYITDIYELTYPSLFKVLTKSWKILGYHCEMFLGDPRVQELIASNQNFDLIIFESLLHECALGFTHKFNAPSIGIIPYRGNHYMWADVIGNTSPYSYVPTTLLALTDRMTFWERVTNTFVLTSISLVRHLVYLPYCDREMRRLFNDSTMPYIRELEKNVSLLFVGSHPSLDYPRPAVNSLVSIGGMHIKPEKPLPKELQEFMDGADHGAILFSFGTVVKSELITHALRQSFVDAFSVLKQRVLWNWSGEPIPNLPSNIRLEKWIPQRDILAHPNIRLFVTHGGYNSMIETIYNGVPVIGIPLHSDQFWITTFVQNLGFGVYLDLSTVTNQTLGWALHAVLTNSSYRENARLASLKLRDNPQTQLEKAVYWTEYVLRHKGAPHLRVGAMDLAWYQYMMLDILAAILAPFVLLTYMYYRTRK